MALHLHRTPDDSLLVDPVAIIFEGKDLFGRYAGQDIAFRVDETAWKASLIVYLSSGLPGPG